MTAGLASVRAILAHLDAHPDALGFAPKRGQEHWPELLRDELALAEHRLAAAAGGQFRFLIVM